MEKQKEESKQPESITPDPWDPAMFAHKAFLSHLECISEMFTLVIPVLKQRDQERNDRIRSLSEEIESDKGERRRLNSIDDAKEFLDHIQKMKQADRMFRQGLITSIVSKFDEFLIEVLKVAYRANPGWLKNPDKKISYKDLLEIQSLEDLKSEIVSKEIDSLMRDSHFVQITFLDGRLKLGVENGFDKWKKFLEITERRNLFVHTGGAVNLFYLDNCKKWGVPVSAKIKEGVYLGASDEYIFEAIDVFYELSIRVLQASVRRLFPKGFDEFDAIFNNQTVDLLSSERWHLAERLFEYALGIPSDLKSRGEMDYYFIINLCIALKGGEKNFSTRLHSIDWRPFHPKYHFAIAVLEDRFSDALILMKSDAVREQVTEKHLKEWPLLREFRKTDGFQEAFREIYGKDFANQLLLETEAQIKAQQTDAANIQPVKNSAMTSAELASPTEGGANAGDSC